MSPAAAGTTQLRRDRRRRAVVLEDERLEHLRRVLAGGVLEVERVAVDHLAVAQREDLHRRALAVGREPDHVDRPDGSPVGRLALGQMTDREEAVAVAGGLLEALVLGRLLHLALQLALDRPRVAREELDHAVDQRRVVLLRDVADARRVTAFDVEVEARDAAVPPRLRAFAGPVLEDAVQHVERLTHLLRVRVRSEVDDAAPVPLAGEHHSRVIVLDGHGDVRKGLVVAQADVERRPVAFDEVLLEVERLDLGARDDHLQVVDPVDELTQSLPRVARALEVRAHPWSQGLGLADVQHLSGSVAEEIDARFRRQALELVLELRRHGA